MIQIELRDGHYCPVARCVVCREMVVGIGNVEWPCDLATGEPTGELYVTHKDCARSFDQLHREDGHHWAWDDLDTFVYRLVHNAGIDLSRAASQIELEMEVGLS